MSNPAGLLFGAKHLRQSEAEGKRVLEVGSHLRDMSLRPLLEHWKPTHYVGLDRQAGHGVDHVGLAEDLRKLFGSGAFDLVLCMEVLEHVRDWRCVVSNLKGVCAVGGILLITTRSLGFPYHGFPADYWRYEEADMRRIFSDFEILACEKDPNPGIFLKLRKPADFQECYLDSVSLYSLASGKRVSGIDEGTRRTPRYLVLRTKEAFRQFLWSVGKRLYRV